jgi:ribosomal protein L7/L12
MSPLWIGGIAAVVLLGLLSRLGERSNPGGHRSDETPPSPQRIDELLRAGRKIDAIKAYRALHGVDLKTAKDAIDARARQLAPKT